MPRDVTVIGRREDCDLRIPLGDVSRKHCRIIKEGVGLRLEDLGSSNGTYHNGQRVQEAMVGAGDTVQIGPVVFVCQIDGHPSEDELRPFDAAAAVASTAGEVVDADALEEVGAEDELEPNSGDAPTQDILARDALEEIGAEGDEGLEAVEAGQARTITGSGAPVFDPMEVLQSEEESDDLVDFEITDDATEGGRSEDSVHINFDQGSGDRPQGRA